MPRPSPAACCAQPPSLTLITAVRGSSALQLAMVQNQWNHFGTGAPPILVYFSGDWDVHWGYGVLTHGQFSFGRGACWGLF